jgi:hypothetical protein
MQIVFFTRMSMAPKKTQKYFGRNAFVHIFPCFDKWLKYMQAEFWGKQIKTIPFAKQLLLTIYVADWIAK